MSRKLTDDERAQLRLVAAIAPAGGESDAERERFYEVLVQWCEVTGMSVADAAVRALYGDPEDAPGERA